MTSISDIPAEIVSNILSRLPARSVLSCQCVCKTFDALIKTPDFIATHVNRTTSVATATATLCTIYYGTHERTTDHILVDNTKGDNSLSSLKPRNPIAIANAIADGDMVCLVDSCNGLFCAHFCYETEGPDILLWNPVTKQNRFLPKPQIDNAWDLIHAFGFVPETKDYKVVRIASYPCKPPNIEVYKMSTDSWTIIEDTITSLTWPVPNDVPLDSYSLEYSGWNDLKKTLHDVSLDVDPILGIHICPASHHSPVYLNGSFHWLAVVPIPTYDDDSFIVIVSFDLRDEQLRLIDVLDKYMVPCSLGGFAFGVLNESLLIVSKKWNGNASDVWMMNEYGIRESWTKQLSLVEFPVSVWPVGYWKDFILLMVDADATDDQELLFLYNHYTRERKSLPVKGGLDYYTLCTYVETLVPVSQWNPIAKEADQ